MQFALEDDCITAGRNRLENRVLNQTSASENVLRSALDTATIPAVAQTIRDNLTAFSTRHTAKALGREVVTYLTKPEPQKTEKLTEKKFAAKLNTFASIALYEMLDSSFREPSDTCVSDNFNDTSMLVSIADRIGKKVEMTSRLEIVKSKDMSKFYEVFNKYFKDPVYGLDYAYEKASQCLADSDISWIEWTTETRVRIGRILIGFVFDTYPRGTCPFQIVMEKIDRKTINYLAPSEAVFQAADHKFETSWIKACVNKPMIVPPLPWKNGFKGGYYRNNEIDRNKIVRGDHKVSKTPALSETVETFLNNLQNVKYKVNPFILDVLQHCADNGITVGKFIPVSSLAFKSLKQKRKTIRSEVTLALAQEFRNFDELYIPWSFDFRGRVYPIPAFLIPQGTDVDKSLLMFAEGGELTPRAIEWIQIQIATCYSGPDKLDKQSFDVRIGWAKQNEDVIAQIAQDPIGTLSIWSEAEEPFGLLAACKEYYDCVITGEKKLTNLMIATDASCSGIQILSGLSLDKNAATLVNVVPGSAPEDAYTAVANYAKTLLVEKPELHPMLTRSVAKKVVMTVPYNASQDTNRKQIKAALKGTEFKVDSKDLSALVTALRLAMKESVLPGPIKLQEWMNKSVLAAMKKEDAPKILSWTTPSGFVVNQECFPSETVRIEGILCGSNLKMDVAVSHDMSKPNPNGHKTSFMPNLIHSLDAALIHQSFAAFKQPFAVIHDSVLTRACDMDDAVKSLQDSYADIFSTERDYLGYIANLLGATKPAPPKETFDPEVVKKSEYFFA
jgi:DNA-directed RNA polymerase